MATSAFKSTSRRGTTNSTSNSSTSKAPPLIRKRSLSVSAVSRTSSKLDIDSEFSNKCDNPLFWTENDKDKLKEKENFCDTRKSSVRDVAEERGRTVTRGSSGVKNGIGRSVSRVRGRSVSRGHYGSAYEAAEAEEKTIKAFCEQVKAIRRNNVNANAAANVPDIPPNLVNPEAVELVLDIRREYARKLDKSEERARKLRSDLAVEEHRGQEISRILKEILSDPKPSPPQRSRAGRKRSNERKKMSKRLTEEALSYFDECVSISTFDSSDFSAPEDLSRSLGGATTTTGVTAPILLGSPSTMSTSFPIW